MVVCFTLLTLWFSFPISGYVRICMFVQVSSRSFWFPSTVQKSCLCESVSLKHPKGMHLYCVMEWHPIQFGPGFFHCPPWVSIDPVISSCGMMHLCWSVLTSTSNAQWGIFCCEKLCIFWSVQNFVLVKAQCDRANLFKCVKWISICWVKAAKMQTSKIIISYPPGSRVYS